MTFKQFVFWCNQRASDGCWSMLTAMVCIGLIEKISKIRFYKREKYWRENYEKQVIAEIVNPIEQKRRLENE